MLLTDVLCYALLTVTMTATCIEAGSKLNEVEESKLDKRISRRTATVIIDGAVPVDRMFQKPKVVVRRVSKKKHHSLGATYAPQRTKYGPPRNFRKPGKKYRSKNGLKHSPSAVKKRASKPRYGPPKQPTMKPVYGPPKRSPHCSRSNSGFGEPPNKFSNGKPWHTKSKDFLRPHFDTSPPPTGFTNDFTSYSNTETEFSSPASFNNDHTSEHSSNDFASRPGSNSFLNPKNQYEEPSFDSFDIKQGYGEPAVDSYGAPIQANLHDLAFSPSHLFPIPTIHDNENYIYNPRLNSESWKQEKKRANNYYANSKPFSAFPKPDVFVTPVPDNQNEELRLNSYSDIYNFRQMNDKKKKMNYYENVKLVNQPWKGAKLKEESSEEVIVGGKYAEPPARYVPKSQPSAPMHNGDDNFAPPMNYPENHDLTSATMSSYVNYKNSNMAFSPQNLNDVFSIVDK